MRENTLTILNSCSTQKLLPTHRRAFLDNEQSNGHKNISNSYMSILFTLSIIELIINFL